MRSAGRLLLFDVTSGVSFAHLKTLLDLDKAGLQRNGRRFFIIGDTSKVSEKEEVEIDEKKGGMDRAVSKEEAAELAAEYSCNYLEMNLA
jgi:hypothetical protein